MLIIILLSTFDEPAVISISVKGARRAIDYWRRVFLCLPSNASGKSIPNVRLCNYARTHAADRWTDTSRGWSVKSRIHQDIHVSLRQLATVRLTRHRDDLLILADLMILGKAATPRRIIIDCEASSLFQKQQRAVDRCSTLSSRTGSVRKNGLRLLKIDEVY